MASQPDSNAAFPQLRRQGLPDVRAAGRGVVLIDHFARGGDRASVLHAAGCKWLGAVGQLAILRFVQDEREAVRWLSRNRGEEDEFWKRCRACGGRARDMPAVDPSLRFAVGDAVRVRAPHATLGRVSEASGGRYVVEIFQGPGTTSRQLPVGAAVPSKHTPVTGDLVWSDHDGAWDRGAIEWLTDDQFVTHTGTAVRRVARDTAWFRDLDALSAPLNLLAEGWTGRADAVEARRAFLRAYYALAATAPGLTGVLSAGVSLFAHQLGVVRRVLGDPVQRYLLADEVGLGKTIEAGLIIRQRLVDAPRSNVVVLVPTPLVPQWKAELSEHLGLRWFRASGIEVAPHETAGSWRRHQTPDLVVIDEAHKIAAGWQSRLKEHRELYDLAENLTARAARVLLLSATPVLNRERDLLGMLHLLDPDGFRFDDVEGFEQRVQLREEVGRLFLGITEDTPAFLLGGGLQDLCDAFPDDAELADLVAAVDPDGPEHAVRATLAEVRGHVSEMYRLHSRLIRNRRNGIAGKTYEVRGRQEGPWVDLEDTRRERVEDLLEDLRGAMLTAANDREEGLLDVYADAFWCFVQASSGDLACLGHLAEYRRTRRAAHLAASGIEPGAGAGLREVDVTPAIRDVLDQFVRLIGVAGEFDEDPSPSPLAQAVAGACASSSAAVAFVSATVTAERLAADLTALGTERVAALTAECLSAERTEIVQAFDGGEVQLLVCDATGEEGLNLQHADLVVQGDLPRVASRIEQRIGRADRHGGLPAPVLCGGVTPTPCGFVAAWHALLSEVFSIFTASTASAIFAVEAVEHDQRRRWFVDGLPDGVGSELFASLRERVAEEQRRVDRLDEFDLLANTDTGDADVVARVVAGEEDFGKTFLDATVAMADAVGGALLTDLNVEDGVVGGKVGRTTSATTHRDALVDRTGRWVAARSDLRSGQTALVRPGEPLIEALREQSDWDEASQVCVVRVLGDVLGVRAAVRVDVVVRVDPRGAVGTWMEAEHRQPEIEAERTEADAPLAVAALQRRVDAYLPPRYVTLWFGDDAEVLDDPEQVAALEAVVAAGTDDPDWSRAGLAELGAVLGRTSGASYLTEVAGAAPAAALASVAGKDVLRAAEVSAKREWGDRVARLRLRGRRGDAAAAREAVREERLSNALLGALRAPVAHWSSVTLVLPEHDR